MLIGNDQIELEQIHNEYKAQQQLLNHSIQEIQNTIKSLEIKKSEATGKL